LVVTYSFCTTVIISSIQRRRFTTNIWSVSAILLFVATAIVHARLIGLSSTENNVTESKLLLILPLVLGIVVLFGSEVRKRKDYYSPRQMTISASTNFGLSENYSIFISYAIAANKAPLIRNQNRNDVEKIRELLKELGYSPIFSADNHNLNLNKSVSSSSETEFLYPPPEQAARIDLRAIESSVNFVLYYPQPTPTSALFELGYAVRSGKRVLILTENLKELPFLLRGINKVYENINILEYETLNSALAIIKENHRDYFD
jgi:hypothetical protein